MTSDHCAPGRASFHVAHLHKPAPGECASTVPPGQLPVVFSWKLWRVRGACPWNAHRAAERRPQPPRALAARETYTPVTRRSTPAGVNANGYRVSPQG